ncbi:MAG: S-layer homology domain-containing protein [Thermoanaerobacterales bacterium]|nr:S-layer homology domain-containing protein [Thermoanaerobacterales bacterium]
MTKFSKSARVDLRVRPESRKRRVRASLRPSPITKGLTLLLSIILLLALSAHPPAIAAEPAPGPAQAAPAPVTVPPEAEAALQKARSYLAAVPPEKSSPWVIIALRAAGGTPALPPGTNEELSPDAPTTDAALRLLLYVATGERGAAPDGLVATLAGTQQAGGKFADTLDGRGEELVNAHVWAVLALRAAGREIPDPEAAMQWLLAQQHPDGGFSFATDFKESDVDMTAMALLAATALGADRHQPAVAAALDFLERNQATGGGFASWGVECSESAASVLQALAAVGEDPDAPRWRKPGGNVLEALLRYQRPDGSFAHAEGGDADLIATCQAAFALGDYIAGRPFWERLKDSIGFTDLPPGYWAAPAVKSLAADGILAGLPDGRFNPDGDVTRAELAAILSRALHLPAGPTLPFRDLPEGHWAAGSIGAAAKAGYLRGRSGGCFAPEAPVTGGELAAILCRVGGLATPPAAPGESWWAPAAEVAQQYGLLGPAFAPAKAATRAEVAWGVYRALMVHARGR